MKIGILTVPFNNNYGGLLQAFALKKVLADMGNEVIFINRRRNQNQALKLKIYRLLVKWHLINDSLGKRSSRLNKYTDEFKKKYLSPITEAYHTKDELSRCTRLGIDFYIVGSDQVWRYKYAGDSIDDFFFSFLQGSSTPRMSYAASFGTEYMDYPYEKTQKIRDLLCAFNGISVREESAVNMLHDSFGIPTDSVKVVLDPTMLLDKGEYQSLIISEPTPLEDYFLTYVLNGNAIDMDVVNNLINSGLKQVDIKAQTGDLSKLSTIEPVEKWLSLICNSKFVITDSFHGTVFSIIFNKPFVVFANPSRGTTRLENLLSMFGLNNRLVAIGQSSTAIENLLSSEPIDWDGVNNRLVDLRKSSLDYLKTTLYKS